LEHGFREIAEIFGMDKKSRAQSSNPFEISPSPFPSPPVSGERAG
jgi:hypothetical protein